MKNLRNKREQGVTLIALVVTIVILILLVVISINAVIGENGIIAKAREVEGVQNIAEAKDANSLQYVADYINEYSPIDKTKSYVGCYADIDGDKEVDGIIYADLAVSVSGQWYNSDGAFSYETITGTKDYCVSGSYKGVFSDEEDNVISVIPGSKGKDRFYVMALEDFNAGTRYCWYDAASDIIIYDYSTVTSEKFGAGKENTTTMISKWNDKKYGAQNDNSTYLDMWGVIQEKVADGWFVPSKEEWSAFGYNLGITMKDCEKKGLSPFWSSSFSNTRSAWTAYFYWERIYSMNTNYNFRVRLSTTF